MDIRDIIDGIFLLVMCIFIIYRICVIAKEIKKIVTSKAFKRAVLILFGYTVTTGSINILLITWGIFVYKFVGSEAWVVIEMIFMLVRIAMFVIFILLVKAYPEIKLIFKLILLILTLGLLVLSLYGMVNKKKSDDREFVDPHEVNGYTRADGTYVNGYYRDGDGNPATRLTKEMGGGYYRKK